ncbi:ATP-binding protein [Paracraurococcus lichenis]|uniref:histidine kinase n=1 Tax=Paracraurococcus lichenis TaxID=3064888 RepID=A0ABT9DZ24_9PROT|nr:ATP-binding protein [Paracraurococcus sp. LOR1-02]MDO9709128.1 ATP-binding protein [Paracraurococcus sp. LOR1-02]
MQPFSAPNEAGTPGQPRAGWWRGLGFGLLAFGLALGARFALAGVLPPTGFPFLTFFPAVILTALFGGLAAGLLVSALSILAALYFFIPPAYSFAVKGSADIIALAFFAAVLLVDCIVIRVMTGSLARVRAERSRNAALAESQRRMATELARRLEELRTALAAGENARGRLAASEARLQALNHELQARVEAEVAAREAAQMRAAHAERLQALGQLAGGIAHDFNNVLQAVAASSGLIERRAEDPAMVRRLARLAAEATARGAAVTQRLLSFARRGALRAAPVDVPALLEGLRDILAHTLGRSLSIRVEAPPGLPPLLADKAQLETVLVNLATNARDAMPEGGTLTFTAAAERASPGHPAGLAPGAYLRLQVQDSGSGMTPEVLARIAEPFFTTKGIGRGTGLGLAMARGFAEQSGGTLLVESEAGEGTCVTLWLPQAAASASPPPPAPPTALRGLTLLLVDDERPVREAVASALRDFGCRVLTAESGEAALPLLRDEARIDVLVTDLAMPGMNGVALIRAARQAHPDLPALLLTGFAGEVEAQGGREFVVLRKPLTGSDLAAVIAALPLEARQAAPAL